MSLRTIFWLLSGINPASVRLVKVLLQGPNTAPIMPLSNSPAQSLGMVPDEIIAHQGASSVKYQSNDLDSLMNWISTVSKMIGAAGQAFLSTGSTLSITDFLAAMMASNLHDPGPLV